jgi:hypothetical protein
MRNASARTIPRRSSRVPITLPILVTSLEPGARFSEVCETMMVSAHGCSMRSPMKLDTGVLLHFHSKEGRETTARVVYCQPIQSDQQPGWRLGATLDRPENFWGLKACPQDWARLPGLAEPSDEEILAPHPGRANDRIQTQVSDSRMRAIAAELVHPLQAEIAELKQKLAVADAKRGRLEVSLSQIPPELEQQLEQRLRKELGPRVLEQAQDQSRQLLEAAKRAIEEKTSETHAEFVERVSQELQGLEQRTENLFSTVGANVKERLNRELGEFHQQVADAGDRLKQESEDLLTGMQQKLGEDHDGRRQELEQVQAGVIRESSRLQDQVAALDSRIATLNQSVHQLESNLDERLVQLARNTVSNARTQLDTLVEALLKDAESRSTRGLAAQIEEATERLKIIQKGIEATASEGLRGQVAQSTRSFEQSLENVAEQSVERWRQALAAGLGTLARSLGDELRPAVEAKADPS